MTCPQVDLGYVFFLGVLAREYISSVNFTRGASLTLLSDPEAAMAAAVYIVHGVYAQTGAGQQGQ